MGKQDGRERQVTVGVIDSSTAPILHVDMDAFFASVELLDHPELVGKPVIVGHNSPRSIVTAATYEARKFGVNSALPMAIALRRCPQAIILEPHYERYQHYSKQVFSICDELTPAVERLGIDEAFLDVSGARSLFGSPQQVAELLRARVRAETGLVCSVGAAATKYVAKVASGLSKPDGLLVIPRDETVAFLHPLPINKLWGVGAKTEEVLRARGFSTIGQIAHADVDTLRRAVGDSGARRLHDLAWGRDDRVVHAGAEEKSVGHEVTFSTDVTDAGDLRRELLRLSNMVAVRLRRHGVLTRTVVLKLRYDDFTTITRSRTIAEPTDLGKIVYDEVRSILESEWAGRPVRLIGVRGEQLVHPDGVAPALWDDAADWREAESVMDAASDRFGRGAVRPAALLGHRATERPRLGQRD
ncbi:DNA polymerase-4 [Microbacteriaceae bacterium SG_E_30_P1]|uniref:DNA polymerase IV n=1 Tax=Antiquaquibacter oligotrophicus TaxID=2880260 RepID=A0ABT6KLH8_9MICO|nr:DNA polymerase IV [Antiquaquibacter oligotrophicus]MDH6180891.1 DNA polymerase-4 [Antiquaquibacter oligotrophicus]UDF13403.1 DNA polymerase IV [Antiquaquibacter oligotrophicus]